MLAGRYKLLARLGRGGFGEVWRAEDTLLGRAIAVKTLTAADDDLLLRFEREARALARLDHPNVVAVYDTGADDCDGYVVMQLLAGPSLAELLTKRGALTLAEALDYAGQAAAGLAAAHAAGIVHRDVSPSNLVLDGAGTLKLVDFGVARLDGTATLTGTGTVFATAGYVSPEQAEGGPADARSDLYSLGCVLYALLAGRPPFTAEHPLGVVQQHLTSPAPRLADVPAELDRLVADLLAKDPRDRPASAEEVRQRLAELTTLPVESAPTQPIVRRGARAPDGRPRTLLIALGLVLLVVGGVLAGTLRGGGAPSTAPPPPTTTSPPLQTTTTGETSTPRTTTEAATPPPAPLTPKEALAAARVAVAQAQADGRLDPSGAADLDNRLDDVAKALDHPNPHDASHKVGDLLRRLDDLVHGGQLTSGGLAAIASPLNRLAALLPAGHGGGDEHG
jgi:serine/threonine protein kinase